MADKKLTLGAIIHNDFELLDLYGPLEMFGCVPQVEIKIIAESMDGVKSAQGPRAMPDYTFADAPPLDLILLPGGWGTIPELTNPTILKFLQDRAPQTQKTMSVCTGSALLARAGLLDGRKATTNKMYFDLAVMQSEKTEWIEEARWVVDGIMVTASGVSAGMDMALAVIADLFGQDSAERVATVTEYQWHTDADSDPFTRFLNDGDTKQLIETFQK